MFQISQIKNRKLNNLYEKSMRELSDFFDLAWKHDMPKLFFINDRNTIGMLQGKKTENWLVGWSTGRDVYLLSDRNYEKESSHKYSEKEYTALIKHELAHCFSGIISENSKKPVWLLEGISIFLSGQNKFKIKPKKLFSFIDFYEKTGKEVYYESGFAVEFLVKKYGKKKLIALLKKLREYESKKDFSKLFKKIYGFELRYENFSVI